MTPLHWREGSTRTPIPIGSPVVAGTRWWIQPIGIDRRIVVVRTTHALVVPGSTNAILPLVVNEVAIGCACPTRTSQFHANLDLVAVHIVPRGESRPEALVW